MSTVASDCTILSGGPGHAFDSTSAALQNLLAEVGFCCLITDDVSQALADRALKSTRLLVINALRWSMHQPRYADSRQPWAFTLEDSTAESLDDFVSSGGGLLAIHTAVICFDAHPVFARLLGASWDWGSSWHPPVGTFKVDPISSALPITREVEAFTVTDELYCDLKWNDAEDAGPQHLLQSSFDGQTRPLAWARRHNEGRVVVDLLGHDAASLNNQQHRTIIKRSAVWVARGAQAQTLARP